MKVETPPKEITRERKPGEAPLHRVPIFDHKGYMHGHVGHHATSSTVARLLGHHGAKLGTKDGRPAWIGRTPPPPPLPQADPTAVAVAEQQAKAPPQTNTLEISLKADKGSTTKKPSAPAGKKK
jgi:hypothetical protein